ncbi:hypothetical protein WJX73_009391 [Symbiochloris irregularis]|uniref:Uncharacterized protein n=1 Tax=Symbiochloris irregularis TaxID=706552 RepID=A0AAW1PGI1_9CHLO
MLGEAPGFAAWETGTPELFQHFETKVTATLNVAAHVPLHMKDNKAAFVFCVGTSSTLQPEGTLYFQPTDIDQHGRIKHLHHINAKLLTVEEQSVLTKAAKSQQLAVQFEDVEWTCDGIKASQPAIVATGKSHETAEFERILTVLAVITMAAQMLAAD